MPVAREWVVKSCVQWSNGMSTSRVGRKPVAIPSGVEIKVHDHELVIKGPKGQKSLLVHPFVKLAVVDNHINLCANVEGKYLTQADTKLSKSIVGTMRARISNLVHGVSAGFERKLMLVGVGYRAQCKGKILSLTLGFSHPVEFEIPAGIIIETPTQTEVLIKGLDKELVGQVAAKIRMLRSPEPYKGKGVRYANEVIEIKETKKK